MNIPLVKDTISHEDIDALRDWLGTYPQLTMSKKVLEFEEKFAEWQQCKYAVMCNSGGSANFLLAYYYQLHGQEFHKKRNNRILIPSLSWISTLSPFLQLGYSVKLVDADKDCLGVDLNHTEYLMKTFDPSAIFVVNVLGFPNKYDELLKLCEKYNVDLMIDDCEDAGGKYNGKRSGNFGIACTKSFYMAHLISTGGEGGCVCTDDMEVYETLKMIRSNGWSRNSNPDYAAYLKKEFNVRDFDEQFNFYLPGMNLRPTEYAGCMGLLQLKKIDHFCESKKKNFEYYQTHIRNDYWMSKPVDSHNFAYPIVTNKREKLVEKLKENNIAARPLIAGSLSKHHAWIEFGMGEQSLPFADKIHDEGLYIPNYPDMTENELGYICETVNEVLK